MPTLTTTVDSQLISRVEKTATTNAVLRSTFTKTTTVSAHLVNRVIKTITASAKLVGVKYTTASAQIMLRYPKYVYVTAKLKATLTKTVAIGAILQAINLTKTVTINSRLGKTTELSVGVDCVVDEVRYKFVVINAYLLSTQPTTIQAPATNSRMFSSEQ